MVILTEEQTALREIGLSPPAVEPITEREMITKLISTWRGRLQELIPRREALDQELVQVQKMIAFGLREVRELEAELESLID